MELLRTILSVPGNRENMLEKSNNLNADAIVIDLEDSIPYEEKARARAIVKDWIPKMTDGGSKLYVRINPLDGGLGQEDLEAVIIPGIDGISQPKPSTGQDIQKVAELLTRLEKEQGLPDGHVKIMPWIETSLALINAYEIAGSSPRINGVIFGANDLALETGMTRTEEGNEILYPRTKVLIAARAAGVAAIDTPYNDFKDEPGLIRETTLARNLGFRGKFVIHPGQVDVVNRIFRPTEEEVAYARQVITAFEEARAKGFASASLDGKMIDIPIAQRALVILLSHEAISAKERS
jgi:citrate lyase subunit beta/citryl-CoA lyase